MLDKRDKKISVVVSDSCWRELKIVSIQECSTLQDVVKDILEKFADRKSKTSIKADVV